MIFDKRKLLNNNIWPALSKYCCHNILVVLKTKCNNSLKEYFYYFFFNHAFFFVHFFKVRCKTQLTLIKFFISLLSSLVLLKETLNSIIRI